MTLSSSPWMVLTRVLSRFAWSYFKEQQPLLLLALAFQMQRQDLFSLFSFSVEVQLNLRQSPLNFSTISSDFSWHTCHLKDSNDMKFLFNPDARPEPKKTLWSWIGENDPPWAWMHIVYYWNYYCIMLLWFCAPYHRICKEVVELL